MTFAPDFAFYRDDRPLVPFVGTDFWSALGPELHDEMARRRDTYPALVTKGRMQRTEADRELDRWAALLRCYEGRAGGFDTGAWPDMIHALRREIGLRRKFYPQWIERRQLTPEDADRRLELIEIFHDILWHGGDHLLSPTEQARAA